MKFLSFIPLWLGAMSWHLWRMLTGRPAFKNLGDTKLTAASFIAVYFAAGLLRWSVLGPQPVMKAIGDLVVIGIGLLILGERRHRSSGLVCAFFGVSAAVDLVVCAAHVVGIFPSVQLFGLSNFLIQLGLMVSACIRFHKEPFAVQASGYRASKTSGNG